MSRLTLTHLRALESESIHIIREVAAEFANPVMLYSIGKDSSCMVRLVVRGFSPASGGPEGPHCNTNVIVAGRLV